MEKPDLKTEQKPGTVLTKIISFRVDEETYNRFQKIALDDKKNMSAILRRVLNRIILINLNI